jgi:hypothetical protein
MAEIHEMIMNATLDIIKQVQSTLEPEDLTRLRLIEMRPRSEEFADVYLSCSIAPNDPDDPAGWVDEQIIRWPQQQGVNSPEDAGRNFNEIGGGVGYHYRFTVDFQLFYNELGTPRDQALRSGLVILTRIQTAIVRDRAIYRKLRDDFGHKVVRWDKAVVKRELRPAGSNEETFLKGKMWLEFQVYQE